MCVFVCVCVYVCVCVCVCVFVSVMCMLCYALHHLPCVSSRAYHRAQYSAREHVQHMHANLLLRYTPA
jgi:hypothetical protein